MYDNLIPNLLLGISITLEWQNLLAILAGMASGIFIGAIPGIGPSTGIALILPFTYALPTTTALIMLIALYIGAEYGGSISAILISTPGTAAAAATVLDGYQLTLKGLPGKALGVSLLSGTVASILATVGLILLALPLVNVALSFGPFEYFALGVFGLSIIAGLSGRNWAAGFVSATIGLILSTVGVDPFSGYPRFAFGHFELYEGIGLIPALIGLFAISVVFDMVEEATIGSRISTKISSALPTISEFRRLVPAMLRGSVIGFVIGVIPGAGGAIASFISYNTEKRLSSNPEKFGTGVLEGVAAPEAANNAVVGGSLVPLLTLGIPGSPTAAILVGALVMHGLLPGPELFTKNPDVVYGLFAGMMLANFAMQAMGLLGMNWWVKAVALPNSILAPLIMALGIVGAYAVRNNMFDVGLMLFFGTVGYILRKYEFSLPAIVLALVLGFMIETNLRRALIVSEGSFAPFLTRPITLGLLIIALLMVLLTIWQERRFVKRNPGIEG